MWYVCNKKYYLEVVILNVSSNGVVEEVMLLEACKHLLNRWFASSVLNRWTSLNPLGQTLNEYTFVC